MKNALHLFRIIGIAEGISYLLLLGVAMPLKYYGGYVSAVKYPGWAHGLLFILYLLTLAYVSFARKWSMGRIFIAFIASLLPFGTILLDSRLKKEEQEIGTV
ncbi:MAG: DUF3817 domain-containing protein [Cytophagaceae bacterium]